MIKFLRQLHTGIIGDIRVKMARLQVIKYYLFE